MNETLSASDDSTGKGQTKRWRSCASWDTAVFSTGLTTDEHDSKEAAEAVCQMLNKQGFGGNGKDFPIRTWVEWIEATNAPSDPSRVNSPATGVAPQNPASAVADDVEVARQVFLTFQTFPDAEGYWLLVRDGKPHLYPKLVYVRKFGDDWRQQEKMGVWWSCHKGTWFQLPLDKLAHIVLSGNGVSSLVGGVSSKEITPANFDQKLADLPPPSPVAHVQQMEREAGLKFPVVCRACWRVQSDTGKCSHCQSSHIQPVVIDSPATSVESPEKIRKALETARLTFQEGDGIPEWLEPDFTVEIALIEEALKTLPATSPVSSVERDAETDLGIPGGVA